jgi:rod shape-determining protein MreC
VFKRYLIPGIFLIIALVLFAGSGASRTAKAQWLSQTAFLPFSKSLQYYFTVQQLRQENFILQNKVTRQALENLNLQNQLKALQSTHIFSYELHGTPFIMAEVVGYSGQFNDRNLIINKGSRDGIEQDSPVVYADGIIGKIIVVNGNNSIILPLTHSQFQLAVMDKSTNVQGVLQSDLQGVTSMNLIKLGSQISIGDTIVTSNLSRLFPKGYPVGKISRIKESQDNLFLSAQIAPFTLVENLEHVFILNKTFVSKSFEQPRKKSNEADSLGISADSIEVIADEATQPVH